MRHHKSIMLSAIAASFIVAHGGGDFMRKISVMILS